MRNNSSIQQIVNTFRASEDRYEAHKQIAPIIRKIASDKKFLFEVIKYNLLKPEYLNKKRHYPTLALDIFENESFNLVANLWFPLPGKSTNISLQSIHHHGNLLLSTISAFGPGYDSILFKKEFVIDYNTEEVEMYVDKVYHNSLYNLEFIDAYTPHVVFYPDDFSITYALWCTDKPKKTEVFKKIGFLKNIKKPLMSALRIVGIHKLLATNRISYFDFYPDGQKLRALKKRIVYKEGTNENFIQNVFHALQKVGFDDVDFLKSLKDNSQINKASHKWIDKFLNKEDIPSLFEEIQIDVPKAHILKEDILSVVK